MVALLGGGRSVVLDYGLWRRSERDDYKRLTEAAGARWRLFYFDVDRDELLHRLAKRNSRHDANALTVTEAALDAANLATFGLQESMGSYASTRPSQCDTTPAPSEP
jgi:predicted kinase